MAYIYLNPLPDASDFRELLRDPKGLAHTILFGIGVRAWFDNTLALFMDNVDPLSFIILTLLNLLMLGIFALMLVNQLGLAHLRHTAIETGYQRPLPPRYHVAFERLLAGSGMLFTIAWLLLLLYLFSPLGPGIATAWHDLGLMLLIACCAYGRAYSDERYDTWYGEIWPDGDDDGGDGWSDEFIPDPTPHNHLFV